MNVCVYGSSSAVIGQIYFDQAFALGQAIAQAGWGLVFGAGDMGVMGAAARGAHSAGGKVIGVIPSFMNVDGIPYAKCDELVVTETMRERKKIMEELAGAFVAAPGGIGTFEEFFEILTLKQLQRHKKAVVLLNTAGYYDPLIQMLARCVEERFAKAQTLELCGVAQTPEEAVARIQNYEYKEFGLKWFTEVKKDDAENDL